MSAEEVDEEVSTNRGLAAPLISIIMLFVVVLGLSAYWWHIADVDACTTKHLEVSLGQPRGTAGTSYMDVILTNTGVGRCTLSGYPSVFLTGSSGGALGQGAATNPAYTPVKLTLGHDGKAHAVVAFPDPANFSSGASGVCSAASQYLKIYPPGLTISLSLPFTQYSCPGFSVGALQSGV